MPEGRGTKVVLPGMPPSPRVSELMSVGGISDGVVVGNAVVPEGAEDSLFPGGGGAEGIVCCEGGLASVVTASIDVWDGPETSIPVSVETASVPLDVLDAVEVPAVREGARVSETDV